MNKFTREKIRKVEKDLFMQKNEFWILLGSAVLFFVFLELLFRIFNL